MQGLMYLVVNDGKAHRHQTVSVCFRNATFPVALHRGKPAGTLQTSSSATGGIQAPSFGQVRGTAGSLGPRGEVPAVTLVLLAAS